MTTTNNFITVDFDKFKQVTTTISNPNTSLGYAVELMGWTSGYILQVRLRHVKSPQGEGLLLDLRLDSSEGWIFLKRGQLSLVVDGENINLRPTETLSSTDSEIKSGSSTREEVYYELSQTILDKISDSNELDIRLVGKEIYFDFDENQIEDFQVMCQQFYNNFYDNTKYTESLEENTKPKGACFIATASMGSYDHPVVMDLRLFRDEWLLKRNWGISFTNWYYTHGPKAARVIEKSNLLKRATYILIVKPLQLITKKMR